MNYLPLPDELLRKVIQYIHPIFEYQKYYESLKYYNKTLEDLEESMYNNTEQGYNSNIAERIINTTEIARLSCLQLEYLQEIENFVKINPLFERPTDSTNFTENQYKLQFERHINRGSWQRLEENIYIHRGMWHHPDKHNEINIFNDINVLHFTGTIRDLIFACIMNNVRGWKTSFNDFMLKKYFINTAISPVKEMHYIQFVNYYYNDNAIRKDKEKRVPKRSTLIKKLIGL